MLKIYQRHFGYSNCSSLSCNYYLNSQNNSRNKNSLVQRIGGRGGGRGGRGGGGGGVVGTYLLFKGHGLTEVT